jgi:hypothetical protein
MCASCADVVQPVNVASAMTCIPRTTWHQVIAPCHNDVLPGPANPGKRVAPPAIT